MNTIRLSATSARNNFFELLDKVSLGAQVIIKKDNKEVAMMVAKVTKTDWAGLSKASQKVKGIMKGYNFEENPLRRSKASNFLGQWDKNL